MEPQPAFSVICEASAIGYVNIALIKYWGKKECPSLSEKGNASRLDHRSSVVHRDCRAFQVSCNTPINDSISLTLNNENLSTHTTIQLCYQAHSNEIERPTPADEMYLNGLKVSIGPRYRRLLHMARCFLSETRALGDQGNVARRAYFRMLTKNFFPTGVGLASSASGASAFASALISLCCKLPKLDYPPSYVLPHPTVLARLASGSGCRSMCDGFAHWRCDIDEFSNGVPLPCAKSIAGSHHWDSLHVLCLVFPSESGKKAHKKEVSSRIGMEISRKTSPLIHSMTSDGSQNAVKKARIDALTRAILERDFSSLAEITMIESDELHEICATSKPAIHYLNSFSRIMMSFVRAYNALRKILNHTENKIKLAYSFDAGPHMFLFCEEEFLLEIYTFVRLLFPGTKAEHCLVQTPLHGVNNRSSFDEVDGFDADIEHLLRSYKGLLQADFKQNVTSGKDGACYLSFIYHSTVGESAKAIA